MSLSQTQLSLSGTSANKVWTQLSLPVSRMQAHDSPPRAFPDKPNITQ